MICVFCKKESEESVKVYLKNKFGQTNLCVVCEGEIERPFSVYVKSSLARAFIRTVREQGGFVKETFVKLMKEFVDRN